MDSRAISGRCSWVRLAGASSSHCGVRWGSGWGVVRLILLCRTAQWTDDPAAAVIALHMLTRGKPPVELITRTLRTMLHNWCAPMRFKHPRHECWLCAHADLDRQDHDLVCEIGRRWMEGRMMYAIFQRVTQRITSLCPGSDAEGWKPCELLCRSVRSSAPPMPNGTRKAGMQIRLQFRRGWLAEALAAISAFSLSRSAQKLSAHHTVLAAMGDEPRQTSGHVEARPRRVGMPPGVRERLGIYGGAGEVAARPSSPRDIGLLRAPVAEPSGAPLGRKPSRAG